MENYVGKICPFCKTEITESDAVKVCSACGIPHHEACWNENQGCTTFGCYGQSYEAPHAAGEVCAKCGAALAADQVFCTQCGTPKSAPAKNVCINCGSPLDEGQAFCTYCGTRQTEPVQNVCTNCGAPLAEGQAFCTNCGTSMNAPKKNICPSCGAELAEGQVFCSQCGHKMDVPVDQNLNAAINQFNAGVAKKKKKSAVVPIVIAVVLVVAIAIGAFVANTMKVKKAEEVRDEYMENVEEFTSLCYTAGVNLEDIADTIQLYWYENIWEDKHGYDINDAVAYAMMDKSYELDKAEDYDSEMASLYAKIKKVPSGLPKEDVDDIEDICDAVKDMYSVYCEYYTFATDPSGSYDSYSASNNQLTDEYIDALDELEKLID